MTLLSNSDHLMLINCEALLGSLEAADELGIDLDPMLRKHHIKPSLLASPEGYLAHNQVIDFLQDVAEHFDCQHFGFLVGKHQPPLNLGPVKQLLKISPTVYSALTNGLKYQPLYTEQSMWELLTEDGYVDMVRRDKTTYDCSAAQLHTLGIVQMFKIFKALCGNDWQPTSISFAHCAPKEKQQLSRYFDCPLFFDREFDCISFPESDLYRPIEAADDELLKMVRAHLDTLLADIETTDNIVHRAGGFIHCKIGTNLCNLNSCAQYLGIHPRALQRKLATHNYTFKQLLLEVRMDLAKQYLRDSDTAISVLADMLGYQNVSAFSRAFKNSQGLPPELWKKDTAKEALIKSTNRHCER
jgi:AraC-like DNA-binding protein